MTMSKTIKLHDVKKHIKKCRRYKKRFDWLGFVENQDLSPEVEALFTFIGSTGHIGYDWVNGNQKLKDLIKSV